MTNTNRSFVVGRAWKDCPKCDGTGLPAYFAPAGSNCPTCQLHFKAVDEAVEEEREACAGIKLNMDTHWLNGAWVQGRKEGHQEYRKAIRARTKKQEGER